MLKISVNKFRKFILYSFFPIMMIVYFMIMFEVNINNIIGLPVLFGIIVMVLPLMLNNLVNIKRTNINTLLVVLWVFYNVASLFAYISNDIPIEAYTSKLRSYIFPMLFYFYGNNMYDISDNFYKSYLYSCAFCFIVGLYLYYTSPSFYTSFLFNSRFSTDHIGMYGVNEDNIMEFTRFSSFFVSSYAISYLSIPALCVSLGFLYRKDIKIKSWVLYLIAIVSFVSALLCLQRTAISYSFLLIIFFAFYGITKGRRDIAYFVLLVIIIFSLTFYFIDNNDRLSIILQLVENRISLLNFKEAMQEGRVYQFQSVISNWSSYAFGSGLGSISFGQKIGDVALVHDGEYIRVLVENGIIGTLIYLVILIGTLIKGIRNFLFFKIEVTIIIFYLFASIGSNALSIFFLFTPIFWFCMGRIWNSAYLLRMKNENKKIYDE